MGMKAFTTIYYDLETGNYSVQPSVMGPVSWTQYGDPTLVRSDEFEAKICGAVSRALAQFNREKFDPALARRRTPDENRDFLNRHKSVSVTVREDGETLIRPLHKEKGGYVGYDEELIVLKPDSVSAGLVDAIRSAFELAT